MSVATRAKDAREVARSLQHSHHRFGKSPFVASFETPGEREPAENLLAAAAEAGLLFADLAWDLVPAFVALAAAADVAEVQEVEQVAEELAVEEVRFPLPDRNHQTHRAESRPVPPPHFQLAAVSRS